MYLINYEIQGPADAPETGTVSSYELIFDDRPGEVPTVNSLVDSFPYVGTFHFRAKVLSDAEEYAWLDLNDKDAPLPIWQEEGKAHHVHVKVLPLSFDGDGEGPGGEVEEDMDWSERDLEDDILEHPASSYYHTDEDGGKTSWSKIKGVTDTVLTSEMARDLTKKGIKVGKVVGKSVGKLWSQIKAVASDTGDGAPPR